MHPLLRRIMRHPSADAPDAMADAPHVEIWGHFIAGQTFHRRLAVAMAVLAFLGMAYGIYMSQLALHRPLVYYVDPQGQAVFGGQLSKAGLPQDVEIQHIAKQFLKHRLGYTSSTIAGDYAAAFNLMTDALQDVVRRTDAETTKERGITIIEYIQDANIRIVLDFDDVEILGRTATTWAVRVTGRTRTWPLSLVAEDAGFDDRLFEANLSIVRVPRTELTPQGALVDSYTRSFLRPKSPAIAQEETVPTPAAQVHADPEETR